MKIGNIFLQGACGVAMFGIGATASAQMQSGSLENLASATPLSESQLPPAVGIGIGPEIPIPAVLNRDGTIPDQYLVTLKRPLLNKTLNSLGLDQTVKTILQAIGGGEVLYTYDSVLYGFAIRMPAAKLNVLKALPQVAAVESNQVLTAQSVREDNPPNWGLDRIDQTDLPLDHSYSSPDWQGAGAHIYIMDSGINPNHEEFKGRISTNPNDHVWVKAQASSPWDCFGHGTLVAGITAGTLGGVAKKATLHSVRVTDCKGNMTSAGVVAAMNWVAKNAQKPAVVNVSLGTTNGRSAAWETASRDMVNANVAVVVAAGNQNISACTRSPGAEPSVLTVGATGKDDIRGYTEKGYYSNYGSCIDLFAPGTDIVGAAFDNNTGGKIGTGTSFAAPHVTGVLAIWRALLPDGTAKQHQDGLVKYHVTLNRVNGAGTGSPNRLLYLDQAPKAVFSYDCKGASCTFNGTASKDERTMVSYKWDFGDGATASGATAVHTYAGSGIYHVVLTVTDDTTQTGVANNDLAVIATSANK